MWTTSSFLAKGARRVMRSTVFFLAIACFALPPSCGADGSSDNPGPPNAPRPADLPAREKARGPEDEASKFLKTVELKNFHVKRVEKGARGPEMQKLAGARFLKQAPDPVQIEIVLKAPLDSRVRDSGPVIVLNDERLTGTTMAPDRPNTLIAFIPDASKLKEKNTLTVIWVGNRSVVRPKTFSFTLDDVKD